MIKITTKEGEIIYTERVFNIHFSGAFSLVARTIDDRGTLSSDRRLIKLEATDIQSIESI